MSNAAKFKKRAADFESQKQFDKAIASYGRAIEAGDAEGVEVDVALLNKVGDLTLRLGRVAEAVTSYERAVEHYAAVGLFNNAIALCNKILRHAPGRVGVYLTLGRVCARKGMRGDATRNFLEYASRMQQEGRTDDAMKSLAEIAGLMPELTEVRRLVEEHAARVGIALPSAGDIASQTAEHAAAQADALVFLDIDYDAALTPALGSAMIDPVPVAPPPSPKRDGSTPASTARTKSLDDLLIFDPSEHEEDIEYAQPLDGFEANAPELSSENVAEIDAAPQPTLVPSPAEAARDVLPEVPEGLTDALGYAPQELDEVPEAEALEGFVSEAEDGSLLDVAALDAGDVVTGSESAEDVVWLDVEDVDLTSDVRLDLVVDEPPSATPEVMDEVDDSSAAVPVMLDFDAMELGYSEVPQQAFSDPVQTDHAEAEQEEDDYEPLELGNSAGQADAPDELIWLTDSAEHSAQPETEWTDVAADGSVDTAGAVEAEASLETEGAVEAEASLETEDTVETEVALEIEPAVEAVALEVERTVEPVFIVVETTDVLVDASWPESLAHAPSNAAAGEDERAAGDALELDELVIQEAVVEDLVVEEAEIESAFEESVLDDLVIEEAELEQSVLDDLVIEEAELEQSVLDDLIVEDVVSEDAEYAESEWIYAATAEPLADPEAVESDVGDETPISDSIEIEQVPVVVEQVPEVIERVKEVIEQVQGLELDTDDTDDTDPAQLVPDEYEDAPEWHDEPSLAMADILHESSAAAAEPAGYDWRVSAPRLDPHDFILPGELPPIIIPDSLLRHRPPTWPTAEDLPVAPQFEGDDLRVELDSVESALLELDGNEFDEQALDGNEFDEHALDFSEREEHALGEDGARNAPAAHDVLDLSVEAPIEQSLEQSSELTPDFPSDLDALLTPQTPAVAMNLALDRCSRLREEADAHPGDWARRRRLAEALLEAGEVGAGLDELAAITLGLEVEGEFEQAARVSDDIVRVAPDAIAHHLKRVELAVRLGDRDRLRESYLDMADALVRSGLGSRAESVYVRVLELDPWDDRARAALGNAAPPPPARPQQVAPADDGYVNLADWLADDSSQPDTRMRLREPTVTGDEDADFDRLLQHFREGVARSLGDDDYESHYDLGVAYKEMGLLDDAIAEFQRALRSPTHRLPAYEALGQCFLEQGSFPVAVTVLSRALHEPGLDDEQRVGVLYLLGYACEALQRRDEARSYFQRVYATDIHFRDVADRLAALDRGV